MSACNALLTEEEYSIARSEGKVGEIDVTEDGSVFYEYLKNLWDDVKNLENNDSWTEADLVFWLDNNIQHRDITPTEFRNFLVKSVLALTDKRCFNVSQNLVISKSVI